MADGNAKAAFPVGTEIPDTYDGHSNPLIVAQYLDSSNNSSYGGVEGVICVRKYVEPTGQKWGDNNDYRDRSNDIVNFLDQVYSTKCSNELNAITSSISIPFYASSASSATPVHVNWFLMSSLELYTTFKTGEGIAWDYWKQKSNSDSPVNSGSPARWRVGYDRNNAATAFWTRTCLNNSSNVFAITTNGDFSGYPPASNHIGVLPACFIPKDTPPRFVVSFNAAGGEPVPADQSVKEGDMATEPTAPAKDGYTFVAWTLNGQTYDFSTPVTENITLVATWEVVKPPYDPEKPSLTDLKAVLATDNPASIYPVGTEIADTCDGVNNPWLIMHYGTAQVVKDGNVATQTGVYLCRKYAQPASKPFNQGGSNCTYANSSLNSYLNNEYTTLCSQDINNLAAPIRFSTYVVSNRISSADAKYWIMSPTQINGQDGYNTGDYAFDLWKQRMGGSSASNSSNAGRKVYDTNGKNVWWTLRLSTVTQTTWGCAESGDVNNGTGWGYFSAGRAILPTCFVPKD